MAWRHVSTCPKEGLHAVCRENPPFFYIIMAMHWVTLFIIVGLMLQLFLPDACMAMWPLLLIVHVLHCSSPPHSLSQPWPLYFALTLLIFSGISFYLFQAPEFIFPVEARQRSWNEKWFDRVGTSYMIGLGVGGVWGLHEGIRNPESITRRMRANSVLNGLTRRGPFMANTLAVLGMF
jgi:hypothetical protein